MALRIPDRVIVFDYGEVVSKSPAPEDQAALLSVAGAQADEFWPVYWRYRAGLDRGVLSTTEYWDRVGADLGREYSSSDAQRLWAADFRSWISVEPGTIDVLAELRDGGTRVALLSNAGFDFGDPFRRSPMGRFFERVFVSAELDLIKPDAEIYRHVARELRIELDRMVFIDNKQENVEGATALGITGHWFGTVEGLRAFLERLAAEAPE